MVCSAGMLHGLNKILLCFQSYILKVPFWELGIITSAEEGGYVFGAVCLSVCLSVRRITRKLVNGF